MRMCHHHRLAHPFGGSCSPGLLQGWSAGGSGCHADTARSRYASTLAQPSGEPTVRRGSCRVGVRCMQAVRNILLAQLGREPAGYPGRNSEVGVQGACRPVHICGCAYHRPTAEGEALGFPGWTPPLRVGTWLLGFAPRGRGAGGTGGCLPTNLHTGWDSG